MYNGLQGAALLVPVLLLPGPGCSRSDPPDKQVDFRAGVEAPGASKMTRAGSRSAQASSVPERSSFLGAAAYLPRDAEVPAWTLKHGPERFDKRSLFEAIDGGAERFLSYGFEELGRATYAPRGLDYSEEIVVEVYLMSSDLAAFGVYGVDATSCDSPADAPGPGCSRGSNRMLRRGAVYCKLTTYDDSPMARKQLGRMATAVRSKVRGGELPPKVFSRFPDGDKCEISARVYLPGDQKEYPGLGAVYRVDYLIGLSSFSLYYRALEDESAAQALFAEQRRLTQAAQQGQPQALLKGVGDEAFLAKGDQGHGFLFRQGKEIGAGSGLKEPGTARRWAAKLAASLLRGAGAPKP